MTALPATWLRLTLGEVVAYGKTEKAEPTELTDSDWILELEDIEKDTSKIIQRMTFAERSSKSTKNRFIAGDVLYGKLRPYLNKVVIADGPGYCTTEIIPIRTSEYLNNRYIFYWLRSHEFLEYVEAVSHGINMPRLGTEAGLAAPFVLAPLNEQKRIADKLDQTLAIVERAKARLARVPEILKQFRQSVLAAATDGRLTEDWREGITQAAVTVAEPRARYTVTSESPNPCTVDASADFPAPPPTGEAGRGREKTDAAGLFDRPHPNLPPEGEGAGIDGRLTEDWREGITQAAVTVAEPRARYTVTSEFPNPCTVDASADFPVPPPTGEVGRGREKKDAASLFDRPHPNLPPEGEGAGIDELMKAMKDWCNPFQVKSEDKEWKRLNLSDLAIEVKNGLSQKPAHAPPGTAILRISSVRPFWVNIEDIRYLKISTDIHNFCLRKDDLLFTRYNGSIEFVGACARLKEKPVFNLVYPDKLIRVRVDLSRAMPAWIEIASNAPVARKIIEGLSKTTAGQTGISGKDLKSLPIPLPSLMEQREIVRRVETLFALADRIEARYKAVAEKVDKLTPALLAKAFRGELVPQDPNDEPAAVLLERIRAQRAAAPLAKTGRGKKARVAALTD